MRADQSCQSVCQIPWCQIPWDQQCDLYQYMGVSTSNNSKSYGKPYLLGRCRLRLGAYVSAYLIRTKCCALCKIRYWWVRLHDAWFAFQHQQHDLICATVNAKLVDHGLAAQISQASLTPHCCATHAVCRKTLCTVKLMHTGLQLLCSLPSRLE